MKKIAVVTDSNSGITQSLGKALGVFVVPMPFIVNGEHYFEDINMSQEEFYAFLSDNAQISTSQPAPGEVLDLWDSVLKEYDELVYIPMSSGLSGSCDTAKTLALDYNGKVEVVDNHRISVTLYQSVLDALSLAKRGKRAKEIREILEENKSNSSIYITVETLYYLKKGGRITPLAAAIGTLLNIKPVLQIQGGKLDAYTKVRGKKSARDAMLKAIRKDMEGKLARFKEDGSLKISASYSGNSEEAEVWKREIENAFDGYEVTMLPLSLSVACHIGYGALAITATQSLE